MADRAVSAGDASGMLAIPVAGDPVP